MKKIFGVCLIIAVLYILSYKDTIIIPKNSIRFRIIANSNMTEDQKIKWEITKELLPVINDISKDANTKEIVENNIKSNITQIKDILNKYNIEYNVNYGDNYFPVKKYDDITYPEGNYESLVITLGQGTGDNWWCVMFPPLCLMEAKKDYYTDKITYKSYIKELIKKY